MDDGEQLQPGLTDAGKAYLEASKGQSWHSSRSFARCGWCGDHLHEIASITGPAHRGKPRKFCDEDCLGLWRRRNEAEIEIPWEDLPLFNPFGGLVDAQRFRRDEKEEADEVDGIEMLLKIDALALDRLMKVTYWTFTWPDGAVSLIAAESREEAIQALAEVGQRTPEDVRLVPDYRLGDYIHDQEVDLARHHIKLRA